MSVVSASPPHEARRERAIEWPTIGVAALLYAGFALVTLGYHRLPWWLVAPLGGYLLAWHGSLQHEVIHGHPTPWRWLNRALVWPALWLYCPYELYRESHQRHHDTDLLTDPDRDPESFYVSAAAWRRMGKLGRSLLTAHNSLLGRLLIGPPLIVARLLALELPRLARGDARRWRIWIEHAASMALVLAWACAICGIPLAAYLGLFVYPALSLTLLRSYAEHSASPAPAHRTACIESGMTLSLLYLNNNLHLMHHSEPWVPWYRLPARWRERREEMLAASGSRPYAGYHALLSHHLLRAREPVPWPLSGAAGGMRAQLDVAGSAPVTTVTFDQTPHACAATASDERGAAERTTQPRA